MTAETAAVESAVSPVWVRPLVAVVGTVLVAAYAAISGFQILVWNPLAAAPGRSRDEIARDIAAAGQSTDESVIWALLLPGVFVAVALMLLAFFVRALSTKHLALCYLWLMALGAPAYFAASFGPGMSLADTYGITGADYSPWALPLLVTNGLAALALVIYGTRAMFPRSPSR